MSELTPGGVVVQRGCRAMVLAGMPGFVRLFVWFLQWNRGSPFISKKYTYKASQNDKHSYEAFLCMEANYSIVGRYVLNNPNKSIHPNVV
jgi:hypothetical protein